MAEETEKESWMNSKWRPAMGWMYMAVCITDFILYPVLWAIFQAYEHISPVKPWDPLTLQGAGLFHIAMGAVLGVAAFGRTQEKLAGATNASTNILPSGPTTFSAPSTGFGTSPGGFSSPVPSSSSGSGFGSVPATTPSGKLIVPQGPQPEL